MRVVLIGAFGRGNLGADAALQSMAAGIHALKPEAELVCICDTPGAVETPVPMRAVAMSWLPESGVGDAVNRLLLGLPRAVASLGRAIVTLVRSDVLIVPGTQLFEDYPAGTRSERWAFVSWLLIARVIGVRVALVSIGAGPFATWFERRVVGAVAADAAYRSYRDAVSKASMGRCGFDVRLDPVCPDLMFRLQARKPVTPRFLEGAAVNVGVDVVSRDTWTKGAGSYEGYVEKLAAFVHWLLDRGVTVRLLQGDTRDSGALAELAGAVTARRFGQACERLLSSPATSISKLMQQIAETDIVAASHYHVAAGSLRLGKPTLSIGLSGASEALLAEMGFSDFSQSIGDIDGDLLVDQFTRLVVDRKAYEQSIVEVRTDIERRLAEQEAGLAELLRERRG